LPGGIRNSKEAVAETIENNLRKLLVRKETLDPAYYQKMSKILEELIQSRKAAQLEYQKYLERIVDLTKQIEKPSTELFPASIDTPAKRALYNNLNQNEDLAAALHRKVMTTKKEGFRASETKIREVKGAIYQELKRFGIDDKDEVERLYKIVEAQKDEY
jgi:type I restriction enzyme, R subunit